MRIAAAVILDEDRRVLLVRKRGTAVFMQPGGKLEDGERPVSCLARELNEELGIHVDETRMVYLGDFSAPAANEEGTTVKATLFFIDGIQNPSPAAEIEELIWLDPAHAEDCLLAPLTEQSVIPLVPSLRSQAKGFNDGV